MKKLLGNSRGSVIVMWALLLPTLLALAGLVVDIGVAYTERSRLQHVADAAALAGASRLSNPDQNAAETLARAYVDQNTTTLPGITITIGPRQYTFTDQNGTQRTRTVRAIDVDLNAESPTFFARIINFVSIPVAVHATAIGPEAPNPFNYALVSAGDQLFTLFGKGAPAGNRYQGSVWANGPVKIDDGGAVHTSDQLTGTLVTASPTPPPDINNHSVFADKVQTGADKIKVDYIGENKNPFVEAFVNSNKNTANTYTSSHPCNVYGSIDFTKLGGAIYVPGSFSGAASIAPTNTFDRATEIVIVAEGNINLTDAIVTNSKAKIILCSLTGNITFNGRIDNFPDVIMLAPNGKINLNCSTTHMKGSLIGKEVEVGNAGNLQIKNDGGGTDDNMNRIRLIE